MVGCTRWRNLVHRVDGVYQRNFNILMLVLFSDCSTMYLWVIRQILQRYTLLPS
jgi:hypothetical protein